MIDILIELDDIYIDKYNRYQKYGHMQFSQVQDR